jgi:hypothetical protein
MRPSFKLGLMAVIAVSVTFLAAGPAMAASYGPVRGNEYIGGVVYGQSAINQAPVIPLTFGGLVRTGARFALPASNHPGAIIRTRKGDFDGRLTGAMSTSSRVYPDCYLIITQHSALKVTGGTGVFRGAYGRGHVHLFFAAFVPRYKAGRHKGQCNPNASPIGPQGAEAGLTASVTPLTIAGREHPW